MIRHLFILFLICPSLWAADGIWMMGANIPNPGAGWEYYDGGDAPEGSWRVNSDSSHSNAYPGTLTFTTNTIPAGTNYFFFKAISYNGTGGGDSNAMWVIVGGTSSNYLGFDNDDWNRYWMGGVAVNVPEATNSFVIQPLSYEVDTNATKLILRGVYVTTNANENVYAAEGTGFDYILDYTYPTNIDTAPAVKRNLFVGGGFDTGIGYGWSVKPNSSARDVSIADMWDTNDFHSGSGSLHISADPIISGSIGYQVVVSSRPFKLSTNRQYTLSFWSKEVGGVNGGVTIRNPIDVPAGLGYSNTWSASATITANTSWHRTSITTNFLCYPTGDFQIEFTVSTNTHIDSIQLEEGELTDYAPARPAEIGLWTGRAGNYFTNTAAVTLPLYICPTNTFGDSLIWQVRGWRNSLVASGTNAVSLTSNILQRVDVATGISNAGSYRVLSWLQSAADTASESGFSVVPFIADNKTNLFAGTTAPPLLWMLPPMWASGMRSTRAMSAWQAFSWEQAEPTDDNWVFFDDHVGRMTNARIQITATFYNEPNWTGQVPNFDFAAMAQYARQVSSNYAGRLYAIEIWNEPLYEMSAAVYADLLITCATNIRAMDPAVLIVGIGGAHDWEWSSNVLHLLSPVNGYAWTQYIDAVSTHFYPYVTSPAEFAGGDAKASQYRSALSAWNPPIWNTEAGAFDLGGSMQLNANFLAPGTALWPHLDSERFHNSLKYYPELQLKNALICFGWGQVKYFNYDSRQVGDYAAYFKGHTSDWTYDDTIKPKRLVLSALNSLIGEATGIGPVSHDGATIYLFDYGDDAWLALWSSNSLPQQIAITNTTLVGFDAMGNPLTLVTNGGTVRALYDRMPIYLKAAGQTPTVLSNCTWFATVTTLSDTNAPHLSVDVSPQGRFSGDYQFRYLAVDDTSIPSLSDPYVILYSTKYDNENWTDWTAYNTRTLTDISTGPHTLLVAAKDAADNAVTNSVVFNEAPGTSITISGGVIIRIGGVTIR